MNNYLIPLSVILSIIPTLSGLIAIYVKLRSDVIKLESEVKHSRELMASYNKNTELLTNKVQELNDKIMNLLIELTLCQKEKKC